MERHPHGITNVGVRVAFQQLGQLAGVRVLGRMVQLRRHQLHQRNTSRASRVRVSCTRSPGHGRAGLDAVEGSHSALPCSSAVAKGLPSVRIAEPQKASSRTPDPRKRDKAEAVEASGAPGRRG